MEGQHNTRCPETYREEVPEAHQCSKECSILRIRAHPLGHISFRSDAVRLNTAPLEDNEEPDLTAIHAYDDRHPSFESGTVTYAFFCLVVGNAQ